MQGVVLTARCLELRTLGLRCIARIPIHRIASSIHRHKFVGEYRF